MAFLFQIIIGIFILGILVLIHELGHFIVAKKCGIRVISFSIGFGKVLFKKTVNDTEYRISAIPFGGYVNMAGENPDDNKSGSGDEFYSKPIWQRLSVAIAGPLANIISAIFFLWLLFIIGAKRELFLDNMTIGAVADSSSAYTAGILAGDSIVAVNNKQVKNWEDMQQEFALQEPEYHVTLMRNGIKEEVTLRLSGKSKKSLSAGLIPRMPPKIGKVTPGLAGDKAGIKPGDSILMINNSKIVSWYQVSKLISGYSKENGPVSITVQRQNSTVTLNAVPEFDTKAQRFLLGITNVDPETRIVRFSPVIAFNKAMEKSWEYTTLIFRVLPKIFALRDDLAGPVGIMQMSGEVAMASPVDLLNFMALIGINLGVLNLMPLIITDGGVILFLLIEAIRRRSLSIKTQLLLNKIAIAFFILLFIYVTKNDILRILQRFNIFG